MKCLTSSELPSIIQVKVTECSRYLKWHLVWIEKIHPGKGNIIRVVTIKDKNGIHKRAVSSIAALHNVNINYNFNKYLYKSIYLC